MKDVDRYRQDIYEGLLHGDTDSAQDARDLIHHYTVEVEYRTRQEPLFGWINGLPEEDRKECLRELMRHLHSALVLSRVSAECSLTVLDEAISAWRTTAGQLRDPEMRAVLLQE
ncbi:MAG: hypothetical protein EPO08_21340 [Rhodospirillaceae bacterium]|nr:MAG: hypothetical protein EPO08_21340 [Rhodospirillaceae bacterium]